tara:strand:+ start:787 stop:1401 length:615 start_codon:yes stop_codon:yes gene_type:complete
MKNKIFFIIIVNLILFTCTFLFTCTLNENEKYDKINNNRILYSNQTQEEYVNLYYACSLIDSLSLSDSVLFNKNIDKILNSHDSCVLSLIDTIVNKTKNSSKFYYKFLETLCEKSDGYVAEIFPDISYELFRDDFKNYVLFVIRENKNTCLFNVLEEGVMNEIEFSLDSSLKKNEIKNFIITNRDSINEKKYNLIMQKLFFVYH